MSTLCGIPKITGTLRAPAVHTSATPEVLAQVHRLVLLIRFCYPLRRFQTGFPLDPIDHSKVPQTKIAGPCNLLMMQTQLNLRCRHLCGWEKQVLSYLESDGRDFLTKILKPRDRGTHRPGFRYAQHLVLWLVRTCHVRSDRTWFCCCVYIALESLYQALLYSVQKWLRTGEDFLKCRLIPCPARARSRVETANFVLLYSKV